MSALPSKARWRSDPSPGESAPSNAPGRHPDDRVEAFFHTLEACLHVPGARARAIRDELEAHVRDRVRDLMLAGMDEPAATDRALAELGGASALARSFHHAIRTPRSWIMNAAVTAIACSALGIGVWTATRSDDPPAAGGVILPEYQHGHALYLSQIPLVGNLYRELNPAEPATPPHLEITDRSLADALGIVASEYGKPLVATWGSLPHEQPVTLLGAYDLDGLARVINEQIQRSGEDAIAFRVTDTAFEAASAAAFDRRDLQTVCYRLDDLLGGQYDAEEVSLLIQQMVESELWVENGGTTATMYSIGSVVFIKAPPRMHEQIRWIFAQLNPAEESSSAPETNEFLEQFSRESVQLEPTLTITPIQHALATDVADAVREYMQLELKVVPGLIVPAVVADAATNSIILQTPQGQGAEVGEFVELIDRPAPDVVRDPRARVRCFRLKHADAHAARDLLGVIFNVSPALRECDVTRSIEVDDNLLILTATADQLDLVERLIEIVDRPARQ